MNLNAPMSLLSEPSECEEFVCIQNVSPDGKCTKSAPIDQASLFVSFDYRKPAECLNVRVDPFIFAYTINVMVMLTRHKIPPFCVVSIRIIKYIFIQFLKAMFYFVADTEFYP